MNGLRLFGLGRSFEGKRYVKRICKHLGHQINRHQDMVFSDGEVAPKSLENVRDCDCYVIYSLYSDSEESVNEKILKLQLFIGSLRDASARRITAILPYLAYQRQDRKVKSREGISTMLQQLNPYKFICKTVPGADRKEIIKAIEKKANDNAKLYRRSI